MSASLLDDPVLHRFSAAVRAAVGGREAYLAAFHAAQALIYDPALGRILARGYEIKEQADYGTGPEARISVRSAEEAIDHATRFVKVMQELLG